MIPLLDRAFRGGFNGGVVEISVNFDHDDPFLVRQTVNLSSLHDDRRDAESFHRYRRDTLVNMLKMGVSSSISVSFLWRLLRRGLAGSFLSCLLGNRYHMMYAVDIFTVK
jgi:hypothetical protein